MLISSTVKRGRYHDSVTLMAVAKRLNTLPGVKEAAAVMGTKENKSILRDGGLWQESFSALGDTDLIVAVAGPDSVPLEAALREVETVLSELRAKTGKAKANPRTLEAALTELPGANLAMISVAGKYASREARLALEHGLHVFLFSDNVPLEQEIALKREGAARRLLVMGPDCGTAIVNGVPLGFANVVRRGGIGVVAAAGTGLQEVTTLIHNAGGGVSQAIGTGGRDIKQEVGGLMCTMGLEALLADPATRPGRPFSIERLRERARILSAHEFRALDTKLPAVLAVYEDLHQRAGTAWMWASVADQAGFVLRPWLGGQGTEARAAQQLQARLDTWAAGRTD